MARRPESAAPRPRWPGMPISQVAREAVELKVLAVPAACLIDRSTAGLTVTRGQADASPHQRIGRLTRCTNRPYKQKVRR